MYILCVLLYSMNYNLKEEFGGVGKQNGIFDSTIKCQGATYYLPNEAYALHPIVYAMTFFTRLLLMGMI